jgi:hypothetical protein
VAFGGNIAFWSGAQAWTKLITTFPLEYSDISAFTPRMPPHAPETRHSHYDRLLLSSTAPKFGYGVCEDHCASEPESIAGPLAQSMSAKGDVLTASRPLPVYPEQPTSSD